MRPKYEDPTGDDEHEAHHEESPHLTAQKPDSGVSKDRLMVPVITEDNKAGTDPSTRNPALMVRQGARLNAPGGDRRLTVPAPHGGVTIVAQKGAVLNVKLEMVVSAKGAQRGSKAPKPLPGRAINVQHDISTEEEDEPTSLPNAGVPPLRTRKAPKNRTP
jgi:hypothetical protein